MFKIGGMIGVVSREKCIHDLFFVTDYHSHLGGTEIGGLASLNSRGYQQVVHEIRSAPFRSKFEMDIQRMSGRMGLGVISDYDEQPLIRESHLGKYAIVTVNKLRNLNQIKKGVFSGEPTDFSVMSNGKINPTDVVSNLINQAKTYEEGIQHAQEIIQGSCSMLLMTKEGVYAARDKLGRTPIIIGEKDGSYVAVSETCGLRNLGYSVKNILGPGEIVLINPDGVEQKKEPNNEMQICSFLWVYYGFPGSDYENINVEVTRYKCGAALAKRDREDGIEIDFVGGMPDSGTAHAIGYSNEAGIYYKRPFVKYPTWSRSFMGRNPKLKDLIARMKEIPIYEVINGQRILIVEDSIVSGRQLRETIDVLYACGALEVHMRPACPPLIDMCDFLNFSRLKSLTSLAARKSIKEIEGTERIPKELLREYANPDSEKYHEMVEKTRQRLNLKSLRYPRLEDLVKAIGLEKKDLCTHCWDGSSHF